MDLGCPLLLGSSVRRLRRRAATGTIRYMQLEIPEVEVIRLKLKSWELNHPLAPHFNPWLPEAKDLTFEFADVSRRDQPEKKMKKA